MADGDAPKGLFDRIPADLLRPLTGSGRSAMWELLVYLNDTLFSVDTIGGNGDGYRRNRIVDEIENFLMNRADWSGGEEDAADAGYRVRAGVLLARLQDCGWLKGHTIGARSYLIMPPMVQRFLELLIKFSEDGAEVVSGRVQSIYNNLKLISDTTEIKGAEAALLGTVARDSRDLLSSLANVSVRIRDVLELLREEEATSKYVKRFFGDYISKLYIKDYRDLRTDNHPLRHRNEIVSLALDLQRDERRRDPMIRAYADHHKIRNLGRAEQHFEKDIAFILRFRHVEEYLDRLDDNVSRATRAALSTLNYRLRTPTDITLHLRNAALAIDHLRDDAPIVWPLTRGALFAADRLREPVVPYVEPEVTTAIRRPVSPEQRAYSELRRAMVRARQINIKQVRRYRDAYLAVGQQVPSEDLPIDSVEDLVMVLALSRASFLRKSMPPSRQKDDPLLRCLRGLDITMAGDGAEMSMGEYLRVPRFVVRRVE